MDLGVESTKRFGSLILVIVMGVLAFFVVKPILFAVIGGLLLAYVFFPVYTRILRFVKSSNLASIIIVLISIAIIAIPLWFAMPVIFKQLFQLYIDSQNIDVSHLIQSILPTASTEFVSQATITVNTALAKAASSILSSLVVDYTNINTISLFIVQFAIVIFVFFFALRDNESLRKFTADVSPFSKTRERVVVQQFKDITNAILYGYVVVGVFQGLCAGLGLLIFGVPNALALTLVAIALGVIPILGMPVLWIPVTIYLFSVGSPGAALGYLLYNLLIVSTIDNVLRAYIVARRAKVSQVIILIGMIGGVIIFNVIGLVLGPLILAYFLTFLDMHKTGRPSRSAGK